MYTSMLIIAVQTYEPWQRLQTVYTEISHTADLYTAIPDAPAGISACQTVTEHAHIHCVQLSYQVRIHTLLSEFHIVCTRVWDDNAVPEQLQYRSWSTLQEYVREVL